MKVGSRLITSRPPKGLTALTLLAVSGISAASAQPPPMPSGTAVRLDQKRRTVSRIEGKDLLASLPDVGARSASDPAAAAIGFISAHRELFRLKNPARELKVNSVNRDELGFAHVRLGQVFRRLEVVHGEMLFHFNRDGALYLVTGSYIPTPTLSRLRPQLNSAAALQAAATAVAFAPGDWPTVLKIWPSPTGEAVLAYEVAATVAPDRAWRVFVDAHSGKILDRISTVSSTSHSTLR